jgi:hypothetical protein
MNPSFARELIEKPSEQLTQKLFDFVEGVVWVDWKESSIDIVRKAAEVMGETALSAECVGETLQIRFRGQQKEVHIPPKPGEQDIALLALNQLIADEFEIRFVKASDGGDTLAFLPLRKQDWLELDFAFGAKVGEAFAKIEPGGSFFGHGQGELPPEVLQQIKMKTKGLHFARANFRLITKAQDAAIRLSAGPGRAQLPVREPLFGDLVLTFFNDLKPIYPAITEGELDEYGMSREDLRQIAWNNLYLAFRQLKIMTTSQSELFVVEGAGDMIACMALHDRQWDTLEKQYGSLVVAFARRDLVLFATASNKAAIAALREAAAKVDSGDPKSLSRQLYQRRANGWQAL